MTLCTIAVIGAVSQKGPELLTVGLSLFLFTRVTIVHFVFTETLSCPVNVGLLATFEIRSFLRS